jgi:acyl transferase domain-containing protein
MLGATGKCFSFDSRAEGFGRGEGIATIIIKRLDEAVRDGDPIRAIIRETLLNQDGGTPGILTPSQEAQEDIIRQCYLNAGLDPLETSYVEAHGTGTKMGDPIEANAIGIVFGKDRSPNQPLLVGSVKSNIGHLESSSGLAAVIKVAMSFEKNLIPPSINFEKPNPGINFPALKLKVYIPNGDVFRLQRANLYSL